MKSDINDTLRIDGVEGVRARHDKARKFNGYSDGGTAEPREKVRNSGESLTFERMDAMEPEPIDWVWPGYIARGKLTLIAGDPGVGKSQISLDVTGRITSGGKWPDGSPAPHGSVLLLTAEDSAKDTVRPRLEAVGADLTRVHRLKSVTVGGKINTFSLQRDLVALGEKVKELGDVTLLVIDPITSYLGAELDSHRTSSVRAVLEPLADWAETHKIGVLGITHPPKAAQAKAMHAITGSLAFVAAARLVFIATEEAETERRLLLAVKNNLGAPAPGLGYRLAQTIIGKGIVASYIAWDSLPVTMTANEAVRAQPEDNKRALNEAKDFLREELADLPKSSLTIQKAAKEAGLSWRTVRRAQEELSSIVYGAYPKFTPKPGHEPALREQTFGAFNYLATVSRSPLGGLSKYSNDTWVDRCAEWCNGRGLVRGDMCMSAFTVALLAHGDVAHSLDIEALVSTMW